MKSLITTLRHSIFFWICSITAIVLIVVSFILPPTGAIDPSVLAATGELFAFAALGTVIYAIDKGVGARVTKGDTTIEVDGDE